MPDSFNPYCEWLGLEPGLAAPDYYQLLGIDRDASPERVKRAADYAINRVRGVRPGSRASIWSNLIDELRKAQVTLGDPDRRAEYDATLDSPRPNQKSTRSETKHEHTAPAETVGAMVEDSSYAYPPGTRPTAPSPAAQSSSRSAANHHAAGHHPTAFPSPIHHPQSPAPKSPWPSFGTAHAGSHAGPAHAGPTHAAPTHGAPNHAGHNFADPMAPVTAPGPYTAPMNPPAYAGHPTGAYAGPHPAAPAPYARGVAGPAGYAHYDPMAPVSHAATAAAPMSSAPRAAVVYAPAPVGATAVRPTPVAVIAPVPMTAPVAASPVLAVTVPISGEANAARKGKSPRRTLVQSLVLGGVAIAMVGAALIGLNAVFNKPGENEPGPVAQGGPTPSSQVPSQPTPSEPAANRPKSSFVPPAKTDLPALPGEAKTVDDSAVSPPASEAPMPETPAPSSATPAPMPTPQPAPEPAPEPTRQPTDQEKAQTAQAIKIALETAAQQNFDAADASLAQVESLPKAAEDEKKFSGARQLVQGARAFQEAVKQAFTALKPEQQISFNNSTVKVLEATPESVSVEVVPGVTKKYTLEKLPLGLKYGFVNAVIAPGDSANALAKAGFHATQTGGDPAEARHFLEEAQAAGADVEGALLVLGQSSGPAAAVAMTTPPTLTPATTTPAPETTPTTPAPSTEPSSSQPTAKELQDLTKLAQEARTALSERNLEEADKALNKAEALAKLPKHKEKIAHLQQLAYYTREFWRAVEESLKGLTSGQEIKIADTLISVVEASPNHIVIRAAGQNRRYSIREMPGGLAMAVANLWLNDGDAATRVARGCMYAVEKKGNDPAKARQLWQEAEQMGLDTTVLQLTLDESYDFTK